MAKTIYDLFRHLIETTTFPKEVDKIEYHNLIDQMERMNLFGNLGLQITTDSERWIG